MALVTVDEINNNLGISLASKIGVEQNNTTAIDRWITKRENEIINLIGTRAWGGIDQVKLYTNNEASLNIIKQAIIEQCEYALDNKGQDKIGGIIISPNGGVQTLKIGDRMDGSISHTAYLILLNAGLLYCGKA